MEPQNTSAKPTKSIVWIVQTIWVNIIIVGLIFAVIVTALSSFIPGTGGQFWQIIIWLASISVSVYAIRLGAKSVLKKSIIPKEDIVKISIWVAMVAVIGELVLIALGLVIIGELVEPTRLLEFIGADVLYFAITYFWLKKLS